jgi:hypothetical protein
LHDRAGELRGNRKPRRENQMIPIKTQRSEERKEFLLCVFGSSQFPAGSGVLGPTCEISVMKDLLADPKNRPPASKSRTPGKTRDFRGFTR